MTEDEIVEAHVETAARFLGLKLSDDSRPMVIVHLRIASQLARNLMDFPLPDESEPAPVYAP